LLFFVCSSLVVVFMDDGTLLNVVVFRAVRIG